MYLEAFFSAAEAVFKRIRETQRDAILNAAEAIAGSLAQGGILAVMDTGHMLKHEALNRAGGLMVISPFSYALQVELTADQRAQSRPPGEQAEIERRTVALALDSSKLRRGDVLIINSNSGRTSNVIETALQCRERGIITLAICSADQMRECSAEHPSGKKLFEVADISLDNGSPYGDAMVQVRDNEKTCPGSGIASAYLFWAIHAETVERLQARGVNPTIFRSVHVSGLAFIDQQREHFKKQGI